MEDIKKEERVSVCMPALTEYFWVKGDGIDEMIGPDHPQYAQAREGFKKRMRKMLESGGK